MPTPCWCVCCCTLGVLLAGVLNVRAADEAEASAGAPRLTVSIAVPVMDGVRPIFVAGPQAHFHVVLHNASQAPVRVWRAGNSWGNAALHFELTDAAGKIREVRRRAVPLLQNAPVWQVLAPGEMLVTDVYFAGDEWETFPLPGKGEQLSVTLKAIYQVAADQAAHKHGVWTGKISSPPKKYRFEDRR